MEPIPSFMSEDDILEKESFIQMCKSGAFIDYDGYGYYSDGKGCDHSKEIYPSMILKDGWDNRFSHILWFNR